MDKALEQGIDSLSVREIRKKYFNNSPMENFFGLLKQEMFYGVKYSSISELEREIIYTGITMRV